MKDVFERIYSQNGWGNAQSRSGDGSEFKQTEAIRAKLPDLFKEFSVTSLLDIPCGDFNWMQLLDLDIEYVGADVVAELIERNQLRYGRPRRHFEILDITQQTLPNVDLILCRDLLVHLSFGEIENALANITRSGSRYLLTTTFPSRGVNSDIKAGQWRPLNLQRPPFSFPPPIWLITEHCTE
ncbi:MAG: class I SAM-dependent methyltransferase, partial [Bradyrhizobium sp.]